MYKYLSKNLGTILEITLVVIFLIALFPVLEIEKTANIKNEKLNTKYSYNYQEITEETDTVIETKEVKQEFVAPAIINEAPVNIPEKKVEPIEEKPVVETLAYQVLETFVGPLTGYGPDCYGCVSGTTYTGHDVYQMYYNDPTYGAIRVLAADPSFPFYSVFRISNVPNMEPFMAIVLDRGSNVGFGKGTLFDLLYPSEAESLHKTDNITFELIRKGA